MLKCLFNKIAVLRPTSLLQRDSSEGVFPWILRDFLEHLFCIWLSMQCKIGVLKNLAKFTTKLMWTAASGVSENRLCLAGCKFLMSCRVDCKSVFKGSIPFHWDVVFNWSCTDEHPTTTY